LQCLIATPDALKGSRNFKLEPNTMKPVKASNTIRKAYRRMKEFAAFIFGQGRQTTMGKCMSETVPDPNAFLQYCKGVLHVGANLGQERDLYAQFGLPVFGLKLYQASMMN
jgi:hypothetical protein